jgi:predicted DNA-binding protein with PD1-like motif
MHRAGEDGNLVVRLEDGEELLDALRRLEISSGAILCGVGMLRGLKLGYWTGTEYVFEEVAEPVELLSLQGNFAQGPEGIIVHVHAAVAKSGSAALGGHVMAATTHNTAEIVIRRFGRILLERKPEPSGLLGLYPSASGSGPRPAGH